MKKETYWFGVFEELKAIWVHDGRSKRPHALLPSGDHSNGFVFAERVMENPSLLDSMSHDLVLRLERCLSLNDIDRVVGPAMGSVTLAHDVARIISQHRGIELPSCLRAYTEKKDEGVVFAEALVKPGERILLVEDVLATGENFELVNCAVGNRDARPLPFIAVLVNRSGFVALNGTKIVSLVNRHMPIWAPHKCPLCKVGSEAINPFEDANWERLNK